MADDAADKDAKNADESTADEAIEAAAEEDAELDAKAAAKDSVKGEDSADGEDAGAADDDEDISLEPDEVENPRRIRKRDWIVTAVAVVAIAIVAQAAIIARLYEEQRIEARSSSEALAAAQEFANIMINVDSDKLDESSSRTLERSTGDFKQKYSESSTTLRQVMIENKAKATGFVVDSAVKSATPDTVEVLMFIDQAVSNLAVPDPRMDRSRVQITMRKIDGRWLASNVELI